MQRIILLFLLLPMGLLAQNSSQKVISKIEKVTVFLNGAEVHRTAKYSLTNGLNELVLHIQSMVNIKGFIQRICSNV
jgi:hypothetical protein